MSRCQPTMVTVVQTYIYACRLIQKVVVPVERMRPNRRKYANNSKELVTIMQQKSMLW